MEKSIFEQLNEIYDEEQLKKAIDNLLVHGKGDPKRKMDKSVKNIEL